jgi:hypothetical protein
MKLDDTPKRRSLRSPLNRLTNTVVDNGTAGTVHYAAGIT